jgi:hypothetical protein
LLTTSRLHVADQFSSVARRFDDNRYWYCSGPTVAAGTALLGVGLVRDDDVVVAVLAKLSDVEDGEGNAQAVFGFSGDTGNLQETEPRVVGT